MNCMYCNEPIESANDLQLINGGRDKMHRNCLLRMSIGSVAHLSETCSCYVEGSTEGDPEGMTIREAADAAVALWNKSRKQNCQQRDTLN